MQATFDEEFDGVDLGDQRLNRRAQILYRGLTEAPEASLAEACGSPAATKAAYRFLENPRVTHEELMACHILNTIERCNELPVVLVPQDTTEVDYTGRQAEGIGYIHKKTSGLLAHTALCLTPSGTPLGILFQEIWARDPASFGKAAARRQRDFLDKESVRWANADRAAAELASEARRVVVIADREGDIYEYLASERPIGLDRLVRVCRDRLTVDGGKLLSEVVGELPILGSMSVEVGRGPDSEPRTAAVVLRAGPVELPAPKRFKNRKNLPVVRLWVVVAQELAAPATVKEPLHWVLFATWPVETAQGAAEAIGWYSRRWVIERFHFVLKSGCQVEKLQLESADALSRALALYSVAACRILTLTLHARIHPDACCTEVLEPHEWKALCCWMTGHPVPPETPPTLRVAIHWIARWGGFLGRKSDGEPGVKVIWRGWARLQVAAEVYRLVSTASNQADT